MRKLVLGALLAVLTAPALARAEAGRAPAAAPDRSATAQPGTDRPGQPAKGADPAQPADEAEDYAARDRAAPEKLADFQGGADGVYLSAGAILVAVLIVVLLTQL